MLVLLTVALYAAFHVINKQGSLVEAIHTALPYAHSCYWWFAVIGGVLCFVCFCINVLIGQYSIKGSSS